MQPVRGNRTRVSVCAPSVCVCVCVCVITSLDVCDAMYNTSTTSALAQTRHPEVYSPNQPRTINIT